MEFNEKIKELRKRKGITQEELAEHLYVSRAAISKWESGRGYPGIDSLKVMAKFFSVTIDELLSGDELLVIAEEDVKQKEMRFRDIAFGLFDLSVVMFLFLPFFGQTSPAGIEEVSILSLIGISPWIRVIFLMVIIGTILFGFLTLALQKCNLIFWNKNKSKISFVLNAIGTFVFIICMQPYAAAFMFMFLLIKAFILIRRQ